MESKSKKTVLILTGIASIAVIIAVTTILIIFNGKGAKIKKQLDLGQKYLSEMNYEEAIACFDKVIEIEPLTVEAYIGKADAYIAMGEYDMAEETLNDGIEVYGKALEKETDSDKKSEYEADIEILTNKLEEVKLVAMPYVELKPIIDAASNIWGRNWDEWTPEDFVKEVDLNDIVIYPSGDGQARFEKKNNSNGGVRIVEWAFSVHMESGGAIATECMWIDFTPYEERTYYNFHQYIRPIGNITFTDGIYNFAAENNLYTLDDALIYLGLDDAFSSGNGKIDINTDYGRGSATLSRGDRESTLFITMDNLNGEVVDVSFTSTTNHFSSDPEFAISFGTNI